MTILLGTLAPLARPAGIAAGALVGSIGAIHLAWAFGSCWPAQTRQDLTAHVVPRSLFSRTGGAASRFPSRAMTLAAAAGFLGLSACLLAPAPPPLVLGVAAIFAVRGVVGLVYWSPRNEPSEPPPAPFYRLNRRFYSPGCLVIAALAAVSVLGGA
jgi:hypothetical protein